MSGNAKELLIDVGALSQQLCEFPILCELAYATNENFVGRVIDGYSADAKDLCLFEKKAAYALCEVQNYLNKNKLGLYVYDAYRPLKAVRDFAKWFYEPPTDDYEIERKRIHYPNIEKTDLAPLGYAPESISRHNFGHAIDLVLVHLDSLLPLDMGACFDYFDELSHLTATQAEIGETAFKNREILVNAMKKYDFIPYEKEFWHFDYHVQDVKEPMDISITPELRRLNV